jgi:hypothetical protein
MLTTSQDYQRATDKLNEIIDKGRASAGNVIQHVLNNQPQDRIVKGKALEFVPTITGISVKLEDVVEETVHRHALNQMAQEIEMPMKFLDSLSHPGKDNDWERELLAHNFNQIFHRRHANMRRLSRSVKGEIRGFLSDSYRRLDSRPIVEAFAQAVQAKGAQPYQGVVTDTKIAIQAIMPGVYEPVPGELVAYGLSLENSDFGNGALSIRAYLLRIWCNNLAITEETMRQIHLGKRLDDNLIYSQRTYALDAQTTVSALKDVIRTQLDAKSLDTRMAAVRQSAGKEVSVTEARARLAKVLNKTEAEAALNAFQSPDVYNLPEGNNSWRLSNAISWIAGQAEDAERKLELSKAAGDVLKAA